MLTSKAKILVNILLISALLLSGLAAFTQGEMVSTQTCESCGMMVAADSQSHLKVVDPTGTIHYVDCVKCALKLLKNYGELNITATCDWNGPSKVITINLKNHVNSTTVNPSSALYIDGSCTKNRIVYDQSSSDALFSNNGTSQYTTVLQNVTIPSNATVMSISQAAVLYAFTSSPDPTPTPSPATTSSPTAGPTATPTAQPTVSQTPTNTPNPTIAPTPFSTPAIISTQQCEACGMEVPADAQVKYSIIDGNGVTHYAECYMCALHLINKYDNLTIISYCDWYGPNCTVTVESSQYGKAINVSPSTAMFLNGGSCVINRVAYNQTAADALLTNGFSSYTLPEQHYDLPTTTKVATVDNAAVTFANISSASPSQTPLILIVATLAGVAIVGVASVAFWKMKR
jgi:hypothetical protein